MKGYIKRFRTGGFSEGLLFAFLLVFAFVFYQGCDKNDEEAPAYNNDKLEGTHYMGIFARDSADGSKWNQINDITFDGQGGYSVRVDYDSSGDTGNYWGNYFVSPDNSLSLSDTEIYGIASSGGSSTAFSDTSSSGLDSSIFMGITVEKSAGLTNSVLTGNYTFCQIRRDAERTKTALIEMTFDGAGNVTGNQVDDTDDGTTPVALTGTYAVDVLYGKLDLTITGLAKTFRGHVSQDGNLVVILDVDNDNEVLLMAGLKNPSSADISLFSGNYQLNMMAGGTGDTNWTSRIDATADGTGNITSTVVADSDGDTGVYTMTYTVATDGEIAISPTGDAGIISPDGSMFIIANTGNSDGEVMMAIGIKK